MAVVFTDDAEDSANPIYFNLSGFSQHIPCHLKLYGEDILMSASG
jgi:hypothetical protein